MSMPSPAMSAGARRFAATYATTGAIAFSTVASAPTPIYRIYQANLGLSAFAITLIFAIYSFTMIGTFLTAARLSDYVGRKPMALTALALNALALATFLAAESGEALATARAIQGVATGIALSTLGAMIADAAPLAAATLNSITAFVGLTVGSLLSGALVAYAPWPTRLVFALLLALTLLLVGALAFAPETVSRKPGAWTVMRPNVAIPARALGALLRLFPLTLSAWALGGFYLSLMPALTVAATGVRSPLVGASVVATLMATGGGAVLAFRHLEATRAVRISSVLLALGIGLTVIAIAAGSPLGLFLGTAVAGVGFGASYGAALRTLLPLAAPHERAGLLSAYFVISYLAFAVPAIAAGLAAPRFGLVATALGYGVLLAISALATLLFATAARTPAAA
jgi:MFS family permease